MLIGYFVRPKKQLDRARYEILLTKIWRWINSFRLIFFLLFVYTNRLLSESNAKKYILAAKQKKYFLGERGTNCVITKREKWERGKREWERGEREERVRERRERGEREKEGRERGEREGGEMETINQQQTDGNKNTTWQALNTNGIKKFIINNYEIWYKQVHKSKCKSMYVNERDRKERKIETEMEKER
jgi:hypothetical protein